MTVCKFFLQGNCKYGDRCWYEHPSGGNQGYSVSAQRQLFGGSRGGSGQKVSFRDSFGQNQNPYRWLNPDAQQQRSTTASSQQSSSAELVKSLSTEVANTWEGGKMWPFTCIAVDKDMDNLPGFEDISPEELRLEAYEALKAGNIKPYVQKVAVAFNQLSTQRQELKNPNVTLKQKLITFIDDCKRKGFRAGSHVSLFSESGSSGGLFSSGGGGLFGSGESSSSSGPFGQSSGSNFGQSGGQSLFGQNTGQSSLFGQSTTSQTGLFGKSTAQSTPGQTGLFGKGATQSVFGQTGSESVVGHGAFVQREPARSVFGQSQTPGEQRTIFGQPIPQDNQNTRTVFGQPVPQTGLFGQNSPFGGTGFSTPQSTGAASSNLFQTSTPTTSLFGKSITAVPPESFGATASPIQGQTTTQASGETTSVYTPMDKLTADEIEQFRAPTFTLGKIPTKPPPKELCF